jgi:hypothetical protein
MRATSSYIIRRYPNQVLGTAADCLYECIFHRLAVGSGGSGGSRGEKAFFNFFEKRRGE